MNDFIAQKKAEPFRMPDFVPNGARIHKDGIYFGLPADHYHSDPALGSSGIRQLIQSPLAYWIDSPYNPDRAEEEEKSAALNLGDYVHDRLLDRSKRFAVKPAGMSFATKEGKAWRDAVPAGTTIITADMAHSAKMIFDALEISGVQQHFNQGEPEVSFFWTEPNGFRCKIRIDFLRDCDAFDLKTIGNQMHKDVETLIAHSVATHRYHVAAFWYQTGIERMRAMLQAKGNDAIAQTPAVRDRHYDLCAKIMEHRGAFPLWYLFLETGGVPNITIRRFVERDDASEINAYFRAAKNETDRATKTFARYMQSHGPSLMWIDKATSKAFTDEEFGAARWILEEA